MRGGKDRCGGFFFNAGRFGVRLYRTTLKPHRGYGVHVFWRSGAGVGVEKETNQ